MLHKQSILIKKKNSKFHPVVIHTTASVTFALINVTCDLRSWKVAIHKCDVINSNASFNVERSNNEESNILKNIIKFEKKL